MVDPDIEAEREPALNIPPTLIGLLAVLVLVQIAVVLAGPVWFDRAVLHFAFIPARLVVPESGIEAVWMWLTYAFLHGDWAHLIVNALWLVIFGTPVLLRIGNLRFALLSVAGALGSVALHLMFHWGSVVPLIGYSGVVSALTGASARFVFNGGAFDREAAAKRPRQTVLSTLTDRRSLGFVLVWMIANAVVGAGMLTVDGPRIAWEAHLGGFLVGLLAFDAFDRQPIFVSSPDDDPSSER